MITIDHTDIYGWEAAIRGMRNPLNSWSSSDTTWCDGDAERTINGFHHTLRDDEDAQEGMELGYADKMLMTRLVRAGNDHSKFRRMINVTCDINAPLYWWKEFDTYKVGTVANSCSTMHKIASKKFELSDFSTEHLLGANIGYDEPAPGVTIAYPQPSSIDIINSTISMLNYYRDKYNETYDKRYWWQMIQLLPSSYNQKRTVQLNYQVLANMYAARKDHKLDEWRDFCRWVESLPYSEIITTIKEDD